MLTLISVALTVLTLLLAVAVVILLIEVFAAVLVPQPKPSPSPRRSLSPRIVVLVPAHNESIGLLPTLADVQAQLRPPDRLLVVADNCTDDTAAIALATGAEITRRDDPLRKGKAYALAWGLRHLDLDPPDVVIILDADCRIGDAAIDRLVEACTRTRRPVQALDLMIAPKEGLLNYRFMEFAWRVKNWVRPLGLKAIGLPCQLMGTGMAFPWDVIRSADLANNSIVEDLKLGLDSALGRKPPVFCPTAIVTSEFPSSAEGVLSQRLRWEQGHIGIILKSTARLILKALQQGNLDLLVLALDAAVPPLALLGVLTIGMVAVTALATLFGVSPVALVVSTISLVGLITVVLLSWLKFGRDILRQAEILSLLPYVIRKLILYRKMLSGKSEWSRTDRSKL
jgi:cellulose synthase/poly-beta-1,6-N-acetylglucosamine synthase-like glycosyltransferase